MSTPPNYIRKILDSRASGGLNIPRGKVTHIYVSHDDWCAIFQGGTCNCNPDVSTQPPKQGKP